ncbi:MAG: hypothetical protein H7144_10345 [Burkholderiales bacterium]|nr:hypothetical protein [Phycisphaerae bacterium]
MWISGTPRPMPIKTHIEMTMFQTLDPRVLLAVQVTLSNGVLNVRGTPGDDAIYIDSLAGQGTPGELKLGLYLHDVKYNAGPVAEAIKTFYLSDLKLAVFKLGAGKDKLVLDRIAFAAINAKAPATASIECGDGDDALYLDQGFARSITAVGGDGNDQIVVAPIFSPFEESALASSAIPAAAAKVADPSGVTIKAGAGNDYVGLGASTAALVYLGVGNDTLEGANLEGAIVYGEAGDDFMNVGYYDERRGGGGASQLYGGPGNDLLNLENTDSGSGLFGGSGNDHLVTDNLIQCQILGDQGDDFIETGASSSTIRGGQGNDSIQIRNSYGFIGQVYGDDGNDIIDAGDSTVGSSMHGGNGNDSIIGTAGDDYLDAGAGTDLIDTRYGNDTVASSDGQRDAILKRSGNDSLLMDRYDRIAPDVKITFDNGDLKIIGTRYSDAITLAAVIDSSKNGSPRVLKIVNGGIFEIYELLTADFVVSLDKLKSITIECGGGDDGIMAVEQSLTINTKVDIDVPLLIKGGDGNDKIHSQFIGPTTFDAGAGDDTYRHFGRSKFATTLIGGSGNDDFFTFSSASIDGGAGDDRLHVYNGSATIQGGDGDDDVFIENSHSQVTSYLINTGDGDDEIRFNLGINANSSAHIEAGGGNDAVLLSVQLRNAVVYLGSGNDTVTFDSYGDNYATDTIYGQDGNDFINAGQVEGEMLLDGGAGDDKLIGAAGHDRLYGHGGRDFIEGGDGNDIVQGGAGDDTLIGGKGSDRIYGNAGADLLKLTDLIRDRFSADFFDMVSRDEFDLAI